MRVGVSGEDVGGAALEGGTADGVQIVDAWDQGFEVLGCVGLVVVQVNSIHSFLFVGHGAVLVLLQVHDLELVVQGVLVHLALFPVLVLHAPLVLPVVFLLDLPVVHHPAKVLPVVLGLGLVLLHQLPVAELDVLKPLLADLPLEELLLVLPLVVALFVSAFAGVELLLLAGLLPEHVVQVQVHAPLHVGLEVLEVAAVLLFLGDFPLGVQLAQLLPLFARFLQGKPFLLSHDALVLEGQVHLETELLFVVKVALFLHFDVLFDLVLPELFGVTVGLSV